MCAANTAGMAATDRRAKMKPEDVEAFRRLRDLWEARASGLGLTQESAGAAMDVSQGAVSHYLNGRIPIGLEACIKWAALLRCDPAEIRPEFEPLFSAVQTARTSEAPTPSVREDRAAFGQLPADVLGAATPRTASRLQTYRSKLEAGSELSPMERRDLAAIIKRLEALSAAIT